MEREAWDSRLVSELVVHLVVIEICYNTFTTH